MFVIQAEIDGRRMRMYTNIPMCVHRIVLSAAAFCLIVAGTPASAADPEGDPYLLDTCIVSGQKLGAMGKPVIYNHEGREIRFCCSGCPDKFKTDPAKYLKQIDEAIIKQQMPSYPLDTCVVSGDKFGGSMGEPVNYVYKNRLIRFCCTGCIKDFEKDPVKYLAKLDQAVVDKQKTDYPLDTCVVSGEKLASPVDYVSGNRLIRLCGTDCIAEFREDPAKHLSKIDEAQKAKSEDPAK
jgi:YHS domain-containing protein